MPSRLSETTCGVVEEMTLILLHSIIVEILNISV
nr:MAG TPA: hypothetical protein [Caudoviricetes sp.]